MKTMRLFALMGLLVPLACESMIDGAYRATHSMIGSDSTNTGSARSKSKKSKIVSRRFANNSGFAKPSSGTSKVSRNLGPVLMGAITVPASILATYFGLAKYLAKPFNPSVLKILAWSAVGAIGGLTYNIPAQTNELNNNAAEGSAAYQSVMNGGISELSLV